MNRILYALLILLLFLMFHNTNESKISSNINTKSETHRLSSVDKSKVVAATKLKVTRDEVKPKALESIFSQSSKEKWKFTTDANGNISRIYNGSYPLLFESQDKIQDFLSKIEQSLGLSEKSLRQQSESQSTRNLLVHDSIQTYEGLEVFDAYFRLIGNKKTKAGFLFNNHTKPVHAEDIHLNVDFDSLAGTLILNEHYGSDLIEIKTVSARQIWADSRPHQISYVYQLRTKQDDLLVVVGAQSRTILHARSERLH